MSDQQEQCNHAPHMLKKLGVGDFPYECSGCGHKFTLLLAATESKAEGGVCLYPMSADNQVLCDLRKGHEGVHSHTFSWIECGTTHDVRLSEPEPPQPSVQPEVKLRKNKSTPEGRAFWAHVEEVADKTKLPNWVEPSVQGARRVTNEEIEAAKVGEYLAEEGFKEGRWENWFVASIAQELLERRKEAPSITSEKIKTLAGDIAKMQHYGEQRGLIYRYRKILEHIEKALREAGVRVG